MIFIVLITICIEQLVKMVVVNRIYNSSIVIFNGFLNLTYVENTGGAFGIGNNSILIFIIANIILIGLLIKFVLSKRYEISTQVLSAISLIIAGGIGNLTDRVFRGYVIDYIDITPIIEYPVFNIEDVCVVIRMYNYCNKYNY